MMAAVVYAKEDYFPILCLNEHELQFKVYRAHALRVGQGMR